MPFCENCGKQLSVGAKFCTGCGAKSAEALAPETTPIQTARLTKPMASPVQPPYTTPREKHSYQAPPNEPVQRYSPPPQPSATGNKVDLWTMLFKPWLFWTAFLKDKPPKVKNAFIIGGVLIVLALFGASMRETTDSKVKLGETAIRNNANNPIISALRSIHKGDYDNAIKRLNGVKTDNGSEYFYTAFAYTRKGDYKNAVKNLLSGIKKNPDFVFLPHEASGISENEMADMEGHNLEKPIREYFFAVGRLTIGQNIPDDVKTAIKKNGLYDSAHITRFRMSMGSDCGNRLSEKECSDIESVNYWEKQTADMIVTDMGEADSPTAETYRIFLDYAKRRIPEIVGLEKSRVIKSDFLYEWGDNEGMRISLTFKANDNLTNNMLRGGIEMDMTRIYKSLYSAPDIGDMIKEVVLLAEFPLVDKYGNESDGIIYKTGLARNEAEKINWDNMVNTRMTAIWQTYFIHPQFYN